MFRYFSKLLFKPPKQKSKPINRIKLKKLSKAKLNDSANEVLILSSMALIYRGETANKIYFKVIAPQEYPPRESKTEAKDGDIIYFYKDEFNKLEYYEQQ